MPPRPLVLLTNPIHPAVHASLAHTLQVRVAAGTDAHTLCREAREASYIVVRAPLPAALFADAPRLRGVVRHGAGLDMIPIEAASTHGVAVANVPGVNARSVAEYVVAQMLQLARHLARIDRSVRGDGWDNARAMADDAEDLHGKTVTIVGMGAIGRALAAICSHGLGMRVIGVRRRPGADEALFTDMPLDAALPQTDYLVLACPLTDATRGLIGRSQLALLRPQARLVNVSRGPVLDTEALVDALRNGRLRGAALDVFDSHPLPPDAPLRDCAQVLLSPHLAGITRESMQAMSEVAAEQVLQMHQGQLPRHFVNPEAQERILARWSQP
ncbi:MAG: hydroxyacid dehydrogenase [Rhodoferax sp.]|nr:hydroxyacid dehydrogenase [Rhodoferax sp.]